MCMFCAAVSTKEPAFPSSSSDQYLISPAASPEILHHTVWRTWLFQIKDYCASNSHCITYTFPFGWGDEPFELGSEVVIKVSILKKSVRTVIGDSILQKVLLNPQRSHWSWQRLRTGPHQISIHGLLIKMKIMKLGKQKKGPYSVHSSLVAFAIYYNMQSSICHDTLFVNISKLRAKQLWKLVGSIFSWVFCELWGVSCLNLWWS